MEQLTVNVEKAGSIVFTSDDMIVPYFVIQGFCTDQFAPDYDEMKLKVKSS